MVTKTEWSRFVTHLKAMGFVFANSEIYGGLGSTWDYGPLGAQLKLNLKEAWWKYFIEHNIYNVGLDSSIFMNSKVWKASGHVDKFFDWLTECKQCHTRYRADQLLSKTTDLSSEAINKLDQQALSTLILDDKNVKCLVCKQHDFTPLKAFMLMFSTNYSITDSSNPEIVYLRPETAQGIFVNFKNVYRSLRLKLPFGIGQIGKAFRNEITPGNFIFRTREFEQMELEFFCLPSEADKWFDYWKDQCLNFLLSVGITKTALRIHEHEKDELAHYAARTIDIEFNYSFGWSELWGLANRTDFDLKTHLRASGEDLTILDQETNKKVIPFAIEPSVGVDRLLLALLSCAYEEQQLLDGTERIVLKLPINLAPYTVAIVPLTKYQRDGAKKIYEQLVKKFVAVYDETGNIGKRYRRQDAIGTPFCITVDYDTNDDQKVTVRFRDSMEQVRVKIDQLESFLMKKLSEGQ